MHVLHLWRRSRARKPVDAAGAVPQLQQRARGKLPRFVRPLPCKELRSLPDDASGWWVVLAEVLAVVILLVLADVTGSSARQLLTAIDNAALADLARSDPLAVCVNGADTLTGWTWREGSLLLQPEFAWPNGTAVPDGNWSLTYNPSYLFAVPGNDTDNIVVLHQTTLAAMRLCEVLTGFADAGEVADAIANGTASQLPLFRGRDQAGRLLWDDPLVLQNMTVQVNDTYSVRTPLLVPAYFYNSLVAYITPLALPAALCWDPVSKSIFESWWEHRGDYVVHSFTPPDEEGTQTHDRPWVVRIATDNSYSRGETRWLQIGPQNAATAECLAQHAAYAAELVRQQATWRDDSSQLHVPVSALNLSLTRLWVSSTYRSKLYECAGGIDLTAPNASATLTKLAALKGRAKARLTTTLFASMREQSYDDVYAVYTGILGALFGALALLVTTLFVYALAAAKRMFVSRAAPASASTAAHKLGAAAQLDAPWCVACAAA